MIEITLVNIDTGEEQTVSKATAIHPPWKVKSIKKTRTVPVLLAVWAQKRGIPIADMFDAARWFLQKDCPFCQLSTQVLRTIEQFGTDRAESILDEILLAKTAGDLERLEQIRKELWSSEQPGSHLQS